MLSAMFFLFFFLMPMAMIFLLRAAREEINKVSIVNVTVLSLYAYSIVGTLPLFFMWDEYRIAMGVVDQNIVFSVFCCSALNIFIFLLGVIFSRRVLGLNPIDFFSSDVKDIDRRKIVALIGVFCLVLFTLYLFLNKIGQAAIFVALQQDVVGASVARSEMGNDLAGGGYHWYYLILHNIGTVVTLAFYASWLKKRGVVLFVLFLCSFLVSAFIAVMATEKAPFIGLLMGVFMTYYLVKSNGCASKKMIILFLALSFSVLVVFYMYFMGSLNSAAAMGSVFSRAFAGSISPAYFYLQYFPDVQDYLMGRTFPNPGGIMPYTPVRYTVDVMNWVNPNLNVVGTMPTVFWGEAYANFGFLGIPIVAFLMGIIVSLIAYVVSRLEVNALTIAFFVWIIMHIKNLSITGFSGYIYDFNMVFMSIFVGAILFSSGSLKIRKRK